MRAVLGGLFLYRFDILWYLCTDEVYPLSGTAAQLESSYSDPIRYQRQVLLENIQFTSLN